MLGRAARLPRHTRADFPGRATKKHCSAMDFLTENLRCTGPATDEPGCPAGLPGDHKRHPVCPSVAGLSVSLRLKSTYDGLATTPLFMTPIIARLLSRGTRRNLLSPGVVNAKLLNIRIVSTLLS